eukprot:CAMPEP_0114122494 /NCGR_PEP_ID=MMETSP0043_2-20121206/7725_1 /TAXON_ID=464988 /ORGANISM="Hemiselmis andersenii, Strain CCMP644" /LENGTH=63 /DNA_ID=CAMNT_0001215213 /DNA_START=235 /DNA_END=426 /DNA_ORIENTATION=-
MTLPFLDTLPSSSYSFGTTRSDTPLLLLPPPCGIPPDPATTYENFRTRGSGFLYPVCWFEIFS